MITRLDGLDDERDERFVIAAAESTVASLELRVRMWNDANGQDQPPTRMITTASAVEPGFMDGLGRLVIEAPNDMLDRVLAIIDAYERFLFHNGPHDFVREAVERIQ